MMPEFSFRYEGTHGSVQLAYELTDKLKITNFFLKKILLEWLIRMLIS